MTIQKRGNTEKNTSTPTGKHQRISTLIIPPTEGKHPRIDTSIIPPVEKDKFDFGISPADEEVEKILLSPLNDIPLHRYVNLKVAKMFELIKVQS
jgi:hypothetical protein